MARLKVLNAEALTLLQKDILKGARHIDGIISQEDGYVVFRSSEDALPFRIEFLKGDFIFRLKTTGKKQPLLKALQFKDQMKILDMTAGLGRDALTLAYHGAHVVAIERNPILFLLLEQAYQELLNDPLFKNFKGSVKFVNQDATEFIRATDEKFDAVYLDPMYPMEDKTAKSKKDIEILRALASDTENLEQLIQTTIHKLQSRVVLKRPPHAEVLLKPRHSLEAKLVRFDIYFPDSIQ